MTLTELGKLSTVSVMKFMKTLAKLDYALGKALPLSYWPISNKEAVKVGAPYFYTGKACVRGHYDRRITGTRKCQACNVAVTYERLANNPEYKARFMERNKLKMREYMADPETKEKYRANAIESYHASPTRKARKAEVDLARRLANPVKHKETEKRWRVRNPDKCRQRGLRRYVRVRNATPNWLTDDHRRQMDEVYTKAQRETVQTGIVHHVDHIVPIAGKRVCGLHVPWNLQILTACENIAKKNAFDGDASSGPY